MPQESADKPPFKSLLRVTDGAVAEFDCAACIEFPEAQNCVRWSFYGSGSNRSRNVPTGSNRRRWSQ